MESDGSSYVGFLRTWNREEKKKGKEKIEKEVTFLFFSPFLPEIPVELIFTRGLA